MNVCSSPNDLPAAGFDVSVDRLDRRRPLGADNQDRSGYLDVARDFCPYVEPAIEAHTFFQSQYPVAALRALSADGCAAEGLLYVAVVHTEWFRLRRARCNPKTRHLICDTILIADDDALTWQQLAGVVMWPQWILKYLYSGVGIMFANFWRGYQSTAADAREIPPPTKTFLAIRSAVPSRDSRFLTADAAVAALIKDSRDDGQNVHSAIAPVDVTDALSTGVLRELRYFTKAQMWSRDMLPEDICRRLARTGTAMSR